MPLIQGLPETFVVDQAEVVAERLDDWLQRHPECDGDCAQGGRRF